MDEIVVSKKAKYIESFNTKAHPRGGTGVNPDNLRDLMISNQIDIINELSAFVAKKGSYEAETGHHDDLVMTLVLFAWTSTQPYFKDLTDINIRDKLYREKIEKMEEELMPFGFIDVGLDLEFQDGDGTTSKVIDDDSQNHNF